MNELVIVSAEEFRLFVGAFIGVEMMWDPQKDIATYRDIVTNELIAHIEHYSSKTYEKVYRIVKSNQNPYSQYIEPYRFDD